MFSCQVFQSVTSKIAQVSIYVLLFIYLKTNNYVYEKNEVWHSLDIVLHYIPGNEEVHQKIIWQYFMYHVYRVKVIIIYSYTISIWFWINTCVGFKIVYSDLLNNTNTFYVQEPTGTNRECYIFSCQHTSEKYLI